MPAIFGLHARWSVCYAHCTFCIALNLAPTTLQFKRSGIKIEYSKLTIDFRSRIRRTNKSASLLYLSYKTIIGMVLYRHESQVLHKKITLFTSSRAIIQQSNWTDNSLQLVFTISFVTVVVRKSDSNRTICSFPMFTRLKLDMYIVKTFIEIVSNIFWFTQR